MLDGTAIGRNMARHRHQEFIRFLNVINAQVPADKAAHVILDSEADKQMIRWIIFPLNAAHHTSNLPFDG